MRQQLFDFVGGKDDGEAFRALGGGDSGEGVEGDIQHITV